MIAPKTNPAAPQAIASGMRPSRRPLTTPSHAPSRPTEPHAAICHGVHGPWPNTMFEASAPTAPTTKPGAPPRT